MVVGNQDVRDVFEDCHDGSIATPGQKLEEPLRNILRGHQSSKVFDGLESFGFLAFLCLLQSTGHNLGVCKGGADGLVQDVVAAGGQGPGEGHHPVLGHHVGDHAL